ncbi:uncharacterized protein LOC110919666 [Helianthus annuus]|uniref:uncharacterized protein LOC110919666 n=1 Tax=Helianthus annuus TaxID=4232 RepID=UPI000B8F19FE|nr:uncharacterized protein LOC110919666 [Helianthus annuus]
MNFLSLNTKGAGGFSKADWVKMLKAKHRISFIAIQESQLTTMTDIQLNRFWDNTSCGKAVVNANGRSGGLFLVWNSNLFSAEEVVMTQLFIMVRGLLLGEVERLNIVNVYALVDPSSRCNLWPDLVPLRESFDGKWIFLGDFNEVRAAEERMNSVFYSCNALSFNNFIGETGLMEYSMAGKNSLFFHLMVES